MSRGKKSILIQYAVTFSVAVAIVFVSFLIQGLFNGEPKDDREIMRILHNAFFASGALIMLFSGLLFVSDEGGFLGIGYALGRAWHVFFPAVGKDPETYAEYRERKTGKKKSTGKLSVLLTGLFFFLVSLILLAIWYNI